MHENIRILIVEDEILIAEDIALRLIEMGYLVAAITENVESALRILEEQTIDLILIDISLQGNRDGIELAKIINEKYSLPFIFLSSFACHAMVTRAKKVKPCAYLLKPFNNRQMHISIEMALDNYNHSSKISLVSEKSELSRKDTEVIQMEKSLFLKKDHHFERVDLDDILWLEAESNYTLIHTQSGKYLYSTVLKKFEGKLPNDQFLRVHRSYIVNINIITGFEGNMLLINEKHIPVSKACRDMVFRRFKVI